MKNKKIVSFCSDLPDLSFYDNPERRYVLFETTEVGYRKVYNWLVGDRGENNNWWRIVVPHCSSCSDLSEHNEKRCNLSKKVSIRDWPSDQPFEVRKINLRPSSSESGERVDTLESYYHQGYHNKLFIRELGSGLSEFQKCLIRGEELLELCKRLSVHVPIGIEQKDALGFGAIGLGSEKAEPLPQLLLYGPIQFSRAGLVGRIEEYWRGEDLNESKFYSSLNPSLKKEGCKFYSIVPPQSTHGVILKLPLGITKKKFVESVRGGEIEDNSTWEQLRLEVIRGKIPEQIEIEWDPFFYLPSMDLIISLNSPLNYMKKWLDYVSTQYREECVNQAKMDSFKSAICNFNSCLTSEQNLKMTSEERKSAVMIEIKRLGIDPQLINIPFVDIEFKDSQTLSGKKLWEQEVYRSF